MNFLLSWKIPVLVTLLLVSLTGNVYLAKQCRELRAASAASEAVKLNEQQEIDVLQVQLKEEAVRNDIVTKNIMSKSLADEKEPVRKFLIDSALGFNWHGNIPI